MWSVQDTQNGRRYNFLTNEEYKVGRKQAAIEILDDLSVSRLHAVFTVSFARENFITISQPSVLKVRDAGSENGTFVNGSIINRKIKDLHVNDTIKFGTFNSEFIVCYEPLVVCASGLDEKEKRYLRCVLFKLGGYFSEEWMSYCTHLVMPCVTISIKAITALVSLRPLVGTDFFGHLVEIWICRSVERRLDEKCYIPPSPEMQPCEETSIFNINMDRATIFQDKSFFFLEENQFKKLQFLILTAGGRTTLLKKNTQFNPELLVGPDACIVKPSTEIDQSLVPFNISDLLSRNKKRFIPEFDIAMAVIYCSRDQFCNPAYNSDSATCGTYRIASQRFSENQVFAEKTEEVIQISPPSLPGHHYFSLQNPTPGTSKESHVAFIETEDNRDGLSEKKKNSDDDIIFEYSSIEERSSKKKTEADDSDDKPEVLLAKVNVPDLKKCDTIFDGNNLESTESRFSPPCIDISDDDLPTVSQDKISSKEIKERSTMECQESELNGFSTFRNFNMSPLREKNAAECQESEPAISNNGEKLNVHPNLTDCQNPSEEEPSSLTKVQYANVVKQTASEVKENAACNEAEDTSVRNFKRFKKDDHDSEERGEIEWNSPTMFSIKF